jgi:hypothetical protein
MRDSHIVELDGVFLGAAVSLNNGFRFKAVDTRLTEIDGSIWPSRDAIKSAARRTLVHPANRNTPRPSLAAE